MNIEELNLCIPMMKLWLYPSIFQTRRKMLHAYLTAFIPWNNAPLFGWTEHNGAKKSIKFQRNISVFVFTWFCRHNVAYHNNKKDNHHKNYDTSHQRYQGHHWHGVIKYDWPRLTWSNFLSYHKHHVASVQFFSSFEAALSWISRWRKSNTLSM